MDNSSMAAITELGVQLATLAVKGTTTAVNTKLKTIKEEKNLEKVRNTYEEIINELLLEREEAIRIAQTYKTELDRIEISDDDILHLHNTVSKILEILTPLLFQPADNNNENSDKINNQINGLEQIKELISVDTLKTMQLLGFNYKAAIGEPLTQICADAITSLGQKNKNKQRKK